MMYSTNFPVPDFKQTDFISFINYWRKYYNYSPDKEEKYYLEPISKSKLSYDDLLLLFQWKNGSNLSTLKQISFDRNVGAFLNEINNLKATGIKSIKDVEAISPGLSAIWLIFLTHIIDEESFPIYDMHVFRAHNFLVYETINEIPTNRLLKLQNYESYLAYFNMLKPQIDNYKAWDEAMWGLGKYLSRFKL